jgi:predicted nucleotidyltransferase component of viral defense system
LNKPEIKNLPASIQDRLLNQARLTGRPLNELLQYYAIERFLYRLTQSNYADRFVLKGALLFRVWGLPGFRPTRDIDLLGHTSNKVENLVAIVKEVCGLKVPEDGLFFDPNIVTGARIKEDADYEGVRVRFIGLLGKVRLHLQIDVGFADVVFPDPVMRTYPVILSMPAPELLGYPPETVVAEKLQAMIHLGSLNSRMKDFYDLWVLAGRFEFNGRQLQESIRRTFEHRVTDIPAGEPAAFSAQFSREKQGQWVAFLKTGVIKDAPDHLELILAALREFILPVFQSTLAGIKFEKKWKMDGLWK